MNFYKKVLIVLLYFLTCFVKNIHCRPKSHGGHSCNRCYSAETSRADVSFSFLFLLTLFMSGMFLVLLGIIKGVMGLFCWAPIGMWGLGALIDLPRPLEHYQEAELAHIPVMYDQIGWPIHPETGKRSVRAISRSTEFYLNTIFFLAYPLTVLVTLFGSCCFKDTCGCEDEQYCYANTIVFTKFDQANKKKNCECRVYGDEDSAEEQDTKYVLQQLHQSQQSLQELHETQQSEQ